MGKPLSAQLCCNHPLLLHSQAFWSSEHGLGFLSSRSLFHPLHSGLVHPTRMALVRFPTNSLLVDILSDPLFPPLSLKPSPLASAPLCYFFTISFPDFSSLSSCLQFSPNVSTSHLHWCENLVSSFLIMYLLSAFLLTKALQFLFGKHSLQSTSSVLALSLQVSHAYQEISPNLN